MATQGRDSRTARGAPPAPVPAPEPEQSEPGPAPGKARPVHVERIGTIRAAIWANDVGQSGVYYVVTPSRVYKDGQNQWQSTDRFGQCELLAAESAHETASANLATRFKAPIDHHELAPRRQA